MADGNLQPIVVTYDGGERFAARIRSHRVVVDQPESGGGADSAPTPLELFGAALGTCTAHYVRQFLHPRDIPYEGLRVEVEQHKAFNPYRLDAFIVRVILPAPLPAAYAKLLERVVRSCPAHGTLTHVAQVLVTIDAPMEAAA